MENFKLSNYKKLNKIGFGSFGNVFKVEDINTKKIYAAKISIQVINIEKDLKFQKNFKREVSTIAKIRHPSILKFIGYCMTDFDNEDKPVIVTDFLPNGSLSDVITLCQENATPSYWNDTIKLINIYGIAKAMSFLHSNHILHCDLKPENILLDQFLFPILADFGLSKNEDLESSTINAKGTLLYIAPEIHEHNEYSQRTDVYAYAYIVYQIITNRRPFGGVVPFRLKKAIIGGLRPEMEGVNEPYKSLIEACWSPNISKRPTFDQIVTQLLENKKFITENVDEDDFLAYVKYIDESPQAFDADVEIINFDKFNKSQTKTIQKVDVSKDLLYPADEYALLSSCCQKIVAKGEDDPDIQYEIACSLLNGEDGFPQKVDLAVKYLQKAIKGGNIKSVIMYNRLIIFDKIPGTIEDAEKSLKAYWPLISEKSEDSDIAEFIFLKAMIEKKKENYKSAIKLLKRAKKKGCGEAMYELGKMHYLGIVFDKNEKKAQKLFAIAKENGCDKSDEFLEKQKSMSTSKSATKIQKQKKNVDIVFFIDGTKTNTFFFDSIRQVFDNFATKCRTKYPTVYFRYGAVIYYDYIFLKKSKNINFHPIVIDLTDSPDELIEFLESVSIRGGGAKFANDWGIGFLSIHENISWNKRAEKVVVHMCNTPGHGTLFTIPINMHKKYFNIPKFGPNLNFSENFNIYKQMQENQNRFVTATISNLAREGVKFFCLNGNENTLYCFSKVEKMFRNAGGDVFVVRDLFGYTMCTNDDTINKARLNKKMLRFLRHVVCSVLQDKTVQTASTDNVDDDDKESIDEEEYDYDDEEKNKVALVSDGFVDKCKRKFAKHLEKFLEENNSPGRSSESDIENYEEVEQLSNDFDFDEEEKSKMKRRRMFVSYEDKDEDEDEDDDEDDNSSGSFRRNRPFNGSRTYYGRSSSRAGNQQQQNQNMYRSSNQNRYRPHNRGNFRRSGQNNGRNNRY